MSEPFQEMIRKTASQDPLDCDACGEPLGVEWPQGQQAGLRLACGECGWKEPWPAAAGPGVALPPLGPCGPGAGGTGGAR